MNYVLIVDDSLVDRRVAGQLLTGHPKFQVEFAADGLEALEIMESQLPLAVVTDLQMPEMNGIELTAAIHARYPAVPVILMTAHGSEEIAVRALMGGAADFIAKDRMLIDLRKAVENVLALAAGERGHLRLAPYLRHEQLAYELQNDLQLIPPLVRHLEQEAADFGLLNPADRVRFGKALTEALSNAICHGNLELGPSDLPDDRLPETLAARCKLAPYCERRVHVQAEFSPREARFTIHDDGPGFNTRNLPDAKADPTRLSSAAGRGLILIRMFMDEVLFNPAGNEITLVKRAPSPS